MSTPCALFDNICTSLDKRKAEAERIRQKYPDRIPVCVSTDIPSTLLTITAGHLRETREVGYRYYRQEEIPCSLCTHCSAKSIGMGSVLMSLLRRTLQDLTVGQFVYVIRKRIKLAPEKAIFIFVDEVLPPTAALMSSIYEEHKYVIFPTYRFNTAADTLV